MNLIIVFKLSIPWVNIFVVILFISDYSLFTIEITGSGVTK